MSRRSLFVIVAGLWGAAAAGCSSLGGSFGPPTHPLIPEAKGIRDSAPVPAPVPRELAKVLHAPYVVEPGDTLLVQPAELDAPLRLPPDQLVLADGTIDLGKYGRPVVAGRTVPEIEAIVQEAVKAKEKDPVTVNVRLVGRASKVYYVLGEVNAPGAFPVTGRETVLDAIVAAGNLTRRASQENIILDRPTPPDGCRVVLPVCWREITQLGDTTTNYQIMPGDRIFVPTQTLCETLLPQRFQAKKACGACVRPQVPCWGGNGGGPGCADPAHGAAAGPLAGRAPGTCPGGKCCADPVAGPVAVPSPLAIAPPTPGGAIPGPMPTPMPIPETVAAPGPIDPIPTSLPPTLPSTPSGLVRPGESLGPPPTSLPPIPMPEGGLPGVPRP